MYRSGKVVWPFYCCDPGWSVLSMYRKIYSHANSIRVLMMIPSNIRGCQSGTWSQRGTKVNGSHHGDNPLLRPTGIQIATKSYATLQAMAPTNSKTVHQTSFTPYREQPRSTRIIVAYPRPAFSATNRTNTFQPVLIDCTSPRQLSLCSESFAVRHLLLCSDVLLL